MKNLPVIVLICCAACCMAEELFLVPNIILTADTFMVGQQTYKIDGIQPPFGEWSEISKSVMEKMIRGKEFRFLHHVPKNLKVREKVRHVYFGYYGRNGEPQTNAAIKLLKMGLARYSNGSMDKNRGKAYGAAEEYAKKHQLGIWHQ